MKRLLLDHLAAFERWFNALLCGDAQDDALRQFPDVYAGNI